MAGILPAMEEDMGAVPAEPENIATNHYNYSTTGGERIRGNRFPSVV
jgi:hypothetical protein